MGTGAQSRATEFALQVVSSVDLSLLLLQVGMVCKISVHNGHAV